MWGSARRPPVASLQTSLVTVSVSVENVPSYLWVTSTRGKFTVWSDLSSKIRSEPTNHHILFGFECFGGISFQMLFYFQFKRMLNKELSHFSESKSGNQISEYICNTFLGEFWFVVHNFDIVWLTLFSQIKTRRLTWSRGEAEWTVMCGVLREAGERVGWCAPSEGWGTSHWIISTVSLLSRTRSDQALHHCGHSLLT